MKDNNIYTTTIQTPLRLMFAAIFKNELILFVPFEKEFIEKKILTLKKSLQANNIVENNTPFKALEVELKEYFNKQREDFTIPIKLIGTAFQIRCWKALLKIPYGKTISYKEEAICIGDIKSCRAVANANGKNSLSIIVPCHRVISSNGTIGGYTGGIEIKEYLLNLEKGV